MENFSFAKVRSMLPNLSSPSAQEQQEITNEKRAMAAAAEATAASSSSQAALSPETLHDAQDKPSLTSPQPIDPRPLTPEEQKPKSNLDLVAECDSFPYFIRDSDRFMQHVNHYYQLEVAAHPDVPLGYVLPSVAEVFRGLPAWKLDDEERTLILASGETEAERTAIVASTTNAMRETGFFSVLKGWRDELYPVYGPDRKVLFSIERAASGLFGIVTYGSHMTVYQRDRTSTASVEVGAGIKIWVPRRSKTKSTYGGMLDNTVAGGLATGENPYDCLVREAEEEASLPKSLTEKRAKAVGIVSYFHIRDHRAGGETGLLQPEVEYVYDFELEEGDKDEKGDKIIPKPGDNEVEEFLLMTVDEVKESMRNGEFKPNTALVLLDFFIRHGILHEGNEKDYGQIVSRLHRLLEFPLR